MDRSQRKELIETYKEMKTYMGVIQITNQKNGKIYIAAYPNLKNKWLSICLQLNDGHFVNAELQKDWNELGSEAFHYEILEEKDTEDISDVRWEKKQMEKHWLDKLEPYGEKGYHKRKE